MRNNGGKFLIKQQWKKWGDENSRYIKRTLEVTRYIEVEEIVDAEKAQPHQEEAFFL